MAKTATIEQILGRTCILKDSMPYDVCRDCTGRSSYALAIECSHYVTMPQQKSIRAKIKQAIREYNDMHVKEVQRHD